MNRFFPVCVAFVAALLLPVAAFPLLTEATEPPNAQNVAPNRTVIIPFGYDALTAKQGDTAIVGHAPILRAWVGTSRISPDPILLLALWRDGTIIWSKARDKNLDTSRNETEHFQTTITEKQVEDFLSAFDKVGFLEFSGKTAPRQISAVGPGPRFFLLETENVQCCFTMDFVFWNGGDIVGNASRSQEHQRMSAKWKSVHELLLDLIPEKGEQISLSIERDAEKRQDVITPVPLRQADRRRAEENARENGALVLPPARNWGTPVRPR